MWDGTDEQLMKEVKKLWYGQNIKRRYEFIIKFEEHVSAGLKSRVFIETICEVLTFIELDLGVVEPASQRAFLLYEETGNTEEFLLMLSRLLPCLYCRHLDITEGPINKRLNTQRARLLLLDFVATKATFHNSSISVNTIKELKKVENRLSRGEIFKYSVSENIMRTVEFKEFRVKEDQMLKLLNNSKQVLFEVCGTGGIDFDEEKILNLDQYANAGLIFSASPDYIELVCKLALPLEDPSSTESDPNSIGALNMFQAIYNPAGVSLMLNKLLPYLNCPHTIVIEDPVSNGLSTTKKGRLQLIHFLALKVKSLLFPDSDIAGAWAMVNNVENKIKDTFKKMSIDGKDTGLTECKAKTPMANDEASAAIDVYPKMCWNCHGTQKLLKCGGCDRAWYCGKKCQRADRARHRKHCPGRKEKSSKRNKKTDGDPVCSGRCDC